MATTDEVTASDETRAVLRRYERELYNARDLHLVDELLAEPMYRHDAGGAVTRMSNADCRERIGGFFRDYADLAFRTVHQIVDGTLASWTYELTMTDHAGATTTISSIEVFEVVDGRITRVWNAAYSPGPWA